MPEKASDYTPRYVDLEDVPMSGPPSADYSDASKLRSIKAAESHMEATINAGNRVSSPEGIHWTAVCALASYVLVSGTEEPSGQHLGDFADDGAGQSSYTDRMWQLWLSSKESAMNASDDESRGEHYSRHV